MLRKSTPGMTGQITGPGRRTREAYRCIMAQRSIRAADTGRFIQRAGKGRKGNHRRLRSRYDDDGRMRQCD